MTERDPSAPERRKADWYLKMITMISGVGLTIFMAFSGWLVYRVELLSDMQANHEARLVKIESVEPYIFSVSDARKLEDKVYENSKGYAVIQEQLRSVVSSVNKIEVFMQKEYDRRSA